jgi:hypothetical protein
MNKCLSLVHLITICFLPLHMASAQSELPQARIVNLYVDPGRCLMSTYVKSYCRSSANL